MLKPIVVQESKGYEELPAGFYRSEFLGATETEITANGETKPVIRFSFRVREENEHKGKVIDGIADPVATPRNKLGRWLNGLSGKPLVAGLSVTPSDYVGRAYGVVLSPNTKGRVTINTFTPI